MGLSASLARLPALGAGDPGSNPGSPIFNSNILISSAASLLNEARE